jgi:hypothetical protein
MSTVWVMGSIMLFGTVALSMWLLGRYEVAEQL